MIKDGRNVKVFCDDSIPEIHSINNMQEFEIGKNYLKKSVKDITNTSHAYLHPRKFKMAQNIIDIFSL